MIVGRLLVVPIGSKVRLVFRSAARLDHRVVVVSGGTTFSRLVVTVVRLLLVPVGGEVRPLGSLQLFLVRRSVAGCGSPASRPGWLVAS